MSTAADLLPDNARPFEQALAQAMTDTLPVPVAETLNPTTAPVRFLPWLAVHDGVRLWYSDWSEARRRQVIAEAPRAAWLVGTRPGAVTYLAYVDGQLVDAVAYPARFVLGRARIGRTPIGHPPWLARYLVRVRTVRPSHALVAGRTVLGRARLKTPSREPRRRCLAALVAAKSPETEYRVDFGHARELLLADGPALDGSLHLGAYVARRKL